MTIENSAIRNHSGDGILLLGVVPVSTTISVTISNTLVSDNGGNGIYIQPNYQGVGGFNVLFNRVEAYNNLAHGIAMKNSNVTVIDSVATHNGFSGFAADHSNLFVNRSIASFNRAHGLHSAGGLFAIMSDFTANYNLGAGWFHDGGIIVSCGGNVEWANNVNSTIDSFACIKQ